MSVPVLPTDTPAPEWLLTEARRSWSRLVPRLEKQFAHVPRPEWAVVSARLTEQFPRLFGLLYRLYGHRYDFFFHLEQIVATALNRWAERPDDLKALDAMREADPTWYQSNRLQGYVLYVDLFAGNLAGLAERIPYLKEMGVSYLHLMPLFRSPEGDNDGGYAISSYREVDPRYGTMEELAALARNLRNHGISLCLDFVFNHTSNEHEWAQRALAGDPEYQAFYRMFPDRSLPDQFERTVRSVFPDEHPGCFTYQSRLRRWVWTTFKNIQWDLNYENPEVFARMADEMLFLANQGVEILRLDAVAFIWKQLGTSCENLPQAHWIIQAYNALTRVAAPAMIFKSEAIVHPDEVARYISKDECQLSYNPNLMALLWESLATREVRLLEHSLRKRFALPPETNWANYVRCHDDIGWAFSDEDAAEIGIRARDHRDFLNAFYTGRHEASFATGLPFQANPVTGDARVAGSCASLAGLERALARNEPAEIDLAIRRILLLYGVIFTIGGIPLVYSGDEIAMLNDYSYEQDPEKAGDSRWVHRPKFDWERAEQRRDPNSIPGRVFDGFLRLSQLRQTNLAFSRSDTEFVPTGDPHVLGYFRTHPEQQVLVLANFSEHHRELPARRLRQLGLRRCLVDLLSGQVVVSHEKLPLEPYQLIVLSTGRRC